MKSVVQKQNRSPHLYPNVSDSGGQELGWRSIFGSIHERKQENNNKQIKPCQERNFTSSLQEI